MKIPLPVLMLAAVAFAALLILPTLITPTPPDYSASMETMNGELRSMVTLMERQNQMLGGLQASMGALPSLMGGALNARTETGLPGSGSAAELSAATDSELRSLIQELSKASRTLASSSHQSSQWQPVQLRERLHSMQERNDASLSAVMTSTNDVQSAMWDAFYFRSMADIMAEYGRPDELYSRNNQLYIQYDNIPCIIDGAQEILDLDLRFSDGICVYASIN
ncbi:MAG: hypothetical protein H8E15_07410 [Planctomycetes bacterium]|nr:hypothetical protein [Planctomycetota bacterium]